MFLPGDGGRGMVAHQWHRCPNFTHPGTPGSRRRGQRPGAGRLAWVIKGDWDWRKSGGAGADLNHPPPSPPGGVAGFFRVVVQIRGRGVFLPRTSPTASRAGEGPEERCFGSSLHKP